MIDTEKGIFYLPAAELREKGIVYVTAAELHAATLIIRGEPAELSEEARLHLVTLFTLARVSGAAILRRA